MDDQQSIRVDHLAGKDFAEIRNHLRQSPPGGIGNCQAMAVLPSQFSVAISVVGDEFHSMPADPMIRVGGRSFPPLYKFNGTISVARLLQNCGFR